jgi:hypothetical protein
LARTPPHLRILCHLDYRNLHREYIRSAAQADAYRTEPPFLLQGSYRNMNRIAEKVLPVMNDRKLLDVVRNQFKIMQTWLEPLLAASTHQHRGLSQLHGAVDACLANYQDLLHQLEAAEARNRK